MTLPMKRAIIRNPIRRIEKKIVSIIGMRGIPTIVIVRKRRLISKSRTIRQPTPKAKIGFLFI